MTAAEALTAAAAGAVAVRLWALTVRPYGQCLACGGTGRNRWSNKKHKGRCRWCRGKGETLARRRSRLAPDAAPLVAVDTGRRSRRRIEETQVTQMSRPMMCPKCDGAGFAPLIGPLYVKCRRCKGDGEIDSFGARTWWLIRVLFSQKG